jgi:hypothetical protein
MEYGIEASRRLQGLMCMCFGRPILLSGFRATIYLFYYVYVLNSSS